MQFVRLGLEHLLAFDAHRFVDEEAEAFGEAVVALLSQKLQDVAQEFRIGVVGHVVLLLDVFADTPTGNQCGPPSTSFSRAERLPPSGVRLRSPSLRLTPEGWSRREERQFTERRLHRLILHISPQRQPKCSFHQFTHHLPERCPFDGVELVFQGQMAEQIVGLGDGED